MERMFQLLSQKYEEESSDSSDSDPPPPWEPDVDGDAVFDNYSFANQLAVLDHDEDDVAAEVAESLAKVAQGNSAGGQRDAEKKGLAYMAAMSDARGDEEMREEADKMLAARLQQEAIEDFKKEEALRIRLAEEKKQARAEEKAREAEERKKRNDAKLEARDKRQAEKEQAAIELAERRAVAAEKEERKERARKEEDRKRRRKSSSESGSSSASDSDDIEQGRRKGKRDRRRDKDDYKDRDKWVVDEGKRKRNDKKIAKLESARELERVHAAAKRKARVRCGVCICFCVFCLAICAFVVLYLLGFLGDMPF